MKWPKRRQSGQAIVEFALITPLALLLILGAFDLSIMGTDTGQSVAAVRHGARLGAELGGTNNLAGSCTGTLPAATSLASQDLLIVSTVRAVTDNMNFIGGKKGAGFAPKGQPESITIYRPSDNPITKLPEGTLKPTDHQETYIFPNFTTPVSGTTQYTLSERCQGPLPFEAEIGVQLVWTYSPVNGIPGPSVTLTEWAVEKMTLCSDNCKP